MYRKIIVQTLLFVSVSLVRAQDTSLDELLSEGETGKNYVSATFKGTKIINGQSVEGPAKGVLQFHLSHRFGTINSGAYNFYGLDEASMRLGFDYGIMDQLAVGIGRSSLLKAYDGYFKLKLLRQRNGMPLTVVLYSDLVVNTAGKSTTEKPINFSNRLNYTNQLLIARKFTDRISIQLMPTHIHRNLVPLETDQNDLLAVGGAARYKLTKRFSLSTEYYYLLPGTTADQFNNSFSVGFDLETGGHVFQIQLTNSLGMIESQFIPQTSGTWGNGDIRIGFNMSRVFTLSK